VIFLSNLEQYKKRAANININANSSATLAIERFKMAIALEPDTPETVELKKRLIEEA
jgi:hypothetical protein